MVPDIGEKYGSDSRGLLHYLFGPGETDEHTDQHLVASWNMLLTLDPGDHVYGSPESAKLIQLLADRLDLPVLARHGGKYPKDKGHIWHCPVRAAPGDRILSDAEWAEVARRVMRATGLAEHGDERDVRWVAVRHAPDHIHLMATLARQDGRAPSHHNDARRAQDECRRIEKDFGLRQLNTGDGTAPPRPKSAEIAKAARRGQAEPPRAVLKDSVRQALVGAISLDDFFDHLRDAGVLYEISRFPSGDVRGYKVAAVGDTTAEGMPVWYSGSKLGLSIGQVRAQLEQPDLATALPEPPESSGDAGTPATARYRAVVAVEVAIEAVEDGDDGAAARAMQETVELVHALAETATTESRADLLAAARAWDRVALSHTRASRAQDRAVRRAAQELLGAGFSLRREDGGITAWLLGGLILLAVAAERRHLRQGHAQQAAAAAESAAYFRSAYRTTAREPLRAMRSQGNRLPTPTRDRLAAALKSTVPEPERLLAQPNWDALAASLHEADQAGHDPEDLLRRARAMRELESADSETAVLAWRVRRLADLPPAPAFLPREAPSDRRNRPTQQADPDRGLNR